jgi:predicted MPP superfamily phosphohydrolase
MLTRRQFLALGGAALASGAGLGLYTWQVEPHWVELVRRPLPLANLPPALEGRTLLQLSDLHVGPRVDSAYLIRALTEASALAPDFVAFTGDFVSYRSAREYTELARVLRALPRGRLATVAALGDLWSPEFEAGAASLCGVRRGLPTIVLAHNPDMQDLPIWSGVSGWVLAGHTHGGQVKPPFLPPPVLPVRNKRYTAGEFVVGEGRRMYINRGLGHLLQVRFNVRPEMTLFTLTRDEG